MRAYRIPTRRRDGRFPPSSPPPSPSSPFPLPAGSHVWSCPRCGAPCLPDNWNSKQECCSACTRTKHRSKPITVDGVYFHSRKEANRYQELRWLERAGEIRDLRRQVPFPLYESGLTPDEACYLHHLLDRDISSGTADRDASWLEDLLLKLARLLDKRETYVGTYVADHVYMEDGKCVVEDVKSAHTKTLPEYKNKRQRMLACYGIAIREV